MKRYLFVVLLAMLFAPASAGAAITSTHLTNGGTGTDNTSFSTASVSSTTSRLELLAINARTANANQPPTPTVTGHGLTWQLVAKVDFDDAGTTDRATAFLFKAVTSSAQTGTVSMSFGATTLDKIDWSLEQFAGVAINPVYNNYEPVIQPTTAMTTGATSLAASLASFEDAVNNVTFASVFRATAENTTPSAGMTEITDDFTSVGSTIAVQTEKATGQVLNPGGSWTTSNRAGVIAAELRVAPGPDPLFPASVGGVFPESSNTIPMLVGNEGDGDLYTVNELQALPDPLPTIKKSTDGGQTWTEVDGGNRPTQEDLESIALLPDSQNYDAQTGLVHVLQQQSSMTYPGDSKKHESVYYHSFWTENGLGGTDAWATKDELVANPYGDAETVCANGVNCGPFDQAVALVQRQDTGDLIALYNTNRDACTPVAPATTCTGAKRTAYRIKPFGGSWGSEVVLDDESGVDFTQSVAVEGDSDVTHVFYKDDTNSRIYYRTLNSSGTLSARTQINSNGTDGVDHALVAPVRLHVGATERIVVAWKRSTGEVLNSVKIDGGVVGSQTQVSAKPAMANPDSTQSRQPVASLAADELGDKVDVVFAACAATPCKGSGAGTVDPDRTVYRNTLSSGGTWGSDVQLLDSSYKVASVQASVFLNSNDLVGFPTFDSPSMQLGVVFDQETCWDPCTPQVDNTVRYTQVTAP